ncbi:MAG: NADH-quinone oxidoreductase subunit C [Candidatus Latescibacterota bacterium]|nr:MAG: NADH-quinone oxidoreductase subunit C [Candidatus Latescibacterota bacterium]
MDIEEIERRLREGVPGGIVEIHRAPYSPHLVVDAAKIRDVCRFLRDDPALRFDYLTHLSALDTGATLCTVYRVLSLTHKRTVAMRAYVPRDNPVIDTVSDIWPSAGWFERESFDLMGIEYRGHPDLRRLLLPDDWEGHPLRKDYVDPLRYQDIDNTRDYEI